MFSGSRKNRAQRPAGKSQVAELPDLNKNEKPEKPEKVGRGKAAKQVEDDLPPALGKEYPGYLLYKELEGKDAPKRPEEKKEDSALNLIAQPRRGRRH